MFESHPGQIFSLPLCGPISLLSANAQMGSHRNFSALLLTLQNNLNQGPARWDFRPVGSWLLCELVTVQKRGTPKYQGKSCRNAEGKQQSHPSYGVASLIEPTCIGGKRSCQAACLIFPNWKNTDFSVIFLLSGGVLEWFYMKYLPLVGLHLEWMYQVLITLHNSSSVRVFYYYFFFTN